MAIVEGAFFKAGLYAAAALIGYRHGADVPGLGPAIDSLCTALGGLLNRQARARATRVASGLEELARAERIDLAPVEATLEDLFARHGLQAPELIDLGLDPDQAAARVQTRGAALFAGLDEGQPELVRKALIRTYATLIEDTDFLELAQAPVLRALLAQRDAIERLPPETAGAVRIRPQASRASPSPPVRGVGPARSRVRELATQLRWRSLGWQHPSSKFTA